MEDVFDSSDEEIINMFVPKFCEPRDKDEIEKGMIPIKEE